DWRGVSGPMKIIGPYANGAAIRKASGWCYTARRPIFEHAKHADHQNFSFLIPNFQLGILSEVRDESAVSPGLQGHPLRLVPGAAQRAHRLRGVPGRFAGG